MQVRDASENKQMADFMSLLLEKSPSLWNICSFFTPVSEMIQFANLNPNQVGGNQYGPSLLLAQHKEKGPEEESPVRSDFELIVRCSDRDS